jgi:hypothetical protein
VKCIVCGGKPDGGICMPCQGRMVLEARQSMLNEIRGAQSTKGWPSRLVRLPWWYGWLAVSLGITINGARLSFGWTRATAFVLAAAAMGLLVYLEERWTVRAPPPPSPPPKEGPKP